MKKLLFSIVAMTSLVGVVIYFFYSDSETQKEELLVESVQKQKSFSAPAKVQIRPKDVNDSKQAPSNEVSKVVEKPKVETLPRPNGTVKIGAEQVENLSKKIEGKWLDDMKRVFVQEFGLTEGAYEEYLEIRKEFMEDKKMAYAQYIQKMRDKYGEEFYKNPALRNEIFINENYSEYLAAMERLLGRAHLERYIQLKSDYNESLEDRISEEMEDIFIEY